MTRGFEPVVQIGFKRKRSKEFQSLAVLKGIHLLFEPDHRARTRQSTHINGPFDRKSRCVPLFRRRFSALLTGRGRRCRRNGRRMKHLPGQIPAGKIGGIEPVLPQDAFRDVAAETGLAGNVDGSVFRQFGETRPKLSERNMLRAGNGSVFDLRRFPRIQQEGIGRKRIKLSGLRSSVQNVFRDHSGQVDRIFCGCIRRSVSQFQSGETIGGKTCTHCSGNHIDPLVRALHPDDLGSENLPLLSEHQLHVEGRSTRIVRGVGCRMQINLLILHSGLHQTALRVTGSGGSQAADLDDRSSACSGVSAVPSGDVVGSDASLLVRRAGKSDKDIAKLDLKDDVLRRANGFYTYFAADIAYHRNKFEKRGFDRVINVWGADHHGHVARLKGALDALGLNGTERLDIVLMQLVKLMRDGELVRMSKRTGKAISLSDLLDEVPVDAARWFFNGKPDSPMDFDLGLAVREDSENPVYYVQYAHARLCSLMKNLEAEGDTVPAAQDVDMALVAGEAETNLIKQLAAYCEEVRMAGRDYDPSHINRYLVELAGAFHKFYTVCRIKGEESHLLAARLKLAASARTVLKNGMDLLGVTAPEKM